MKSRGQLAALLGAVVLLALTTGGSSASRGASIEHWNDWTALRFNARSGPFFSGRVEMHLDETGGEKLLRTSTTARFLGAAVARAQTRSHLDPQTGRPLRYVSLSRKRGRRFVFGEQGYTVEKLVPPGGPEVPSDQWEVRSVQEFAYPLDAQGRVEPVFDYYGMLLHLGRLDLHRRGDEETIHVATTRGPVPYVVRVGERRTTQRSFTNLDGGAKRKLACDELRLRILPADPEQADEGFLRMEGETELWVEAQSKTLIEVHGNAPRVPGRLRLRLSALDH